MDRLGTQVAAHSIGDGSIKSLLDAISNAREANKKIEQKKVTEFCTEWSTSRPAIRMISPDSASWPI
ncbi:hypothetical protein [Maridesulfovibrio sp.]|uniref:hypothetical protein n=1 Tax=Maridesulfovibrio sp. TaxID=2795000 RepID=UPI0029CA9CD0|nr:hypothetical protein [Maridesulfovibrio sp.]